MIDRRALIVGATALVSAGRATTTRAHGDLRAALDSAQAERDADRALRLLAPFDARVLAPPAQLDLLCARAGLAADAEIVRRFAIDPRAKGPPLNPEHAALLLRRKLGDGIDLKATVERLEVERSLAQRRAIRLFDRLGIAGATTGTRFSRLWPDSRYHYPDPAAALADMNGWTGRLRAALPLLVGAVPLYCAKVAALAPTATDIAQRHYGYRTLPTPTIPGGYVPDLQRLDDRPRWTMPSVVAHELLPGHMVQMPLEAAADPHPLRLEYASGFGEGWGFYAEHRVAESGLYAADPLAELGYLHWRLFRLGRALVDLAIHLEGLSLADARAKLVAWQGEPAYFAPFDTDLARIVQEPMTRVTEMLAALAIEDAALGRSPQSLHAFHALVLNHGRMRSDELARRARHLRW